MIENISRNKLQLQLRFVLKNKDLKIKVRRINLKQILVNQLKWILDKLFTILCGRYQLMQHYLRSGFTSLGWASFLLICMGDSMGTVFCLGIMSKPRFLKDSKIWSTYCSVVRYFEWPVWQWNCLKWHLCNQVFTLHS